MTVKNTLSAALLTLSSLVSVAQTQHSNVHIGFCYPISSNGMAAKEYSNKASIHAIAGLSAQEESFCASGVSSIILKDAKGLVASGFSNHIGGSANALVAAGFFNHVRYNMKGMQAAGFMNLACEVNGFQVAGFSNITTGNAKGMQGAGFMNIAHNADVQLGGFVNLAQKAPVQLAGFINIAKQTELQLAGFANICADTQKVQLAGFINQAGDVNTQVAGFINIAKKVKGTQVAGFINIADSSEYPIGIINIIKNGERGFALSVDENATTIASFRSGSKHLYGILGLGYNFRSSRVLYAMEAGIGAHFPISKTVRFNVEGVATSLSDLWSEANLKSTVRVYPTFKLGEQWEIFAGPSVSFVEFNSFTSGDIINTFIWSHNRWGRTYGMSLGGFAGVQLHF